jgi:hypothetical protein
MGLFRTANVGKDLAQRRRRYPEAWRLGEMLAEDRFELSPNEDRLFTLETLDAYMQEVGADAVRLVAASAREKGGSMPTEFLSTVGIACGYTLEPVMREFISSGMAAENLQEINAHRDDYDRGRELAEKSFGVEWLAEAPLIGQGIEDQIDLKWATAIEDNAISPPFGQPAVARAGVKARAAELIRERLFQSVP